MNSATHNLIVVTDDDVVADNVLQALDSDSRIRVEIRCRTIGELPRKVSAEGEIVLVDVDPNPAQALEELTEMVSRFHHSCFIILSSQWEEKLLLESMSIGARHYLRKESMKADLADAIHRLAIPTDPVPRARGSIITVLSAGGGCGATTVAVNLANEMCIAEDRPVLLVDMDTAYGAVATFLNLGGEFGLADVMSNGNAVDCDLVVTSTVPYSSNLHVLLSPASISFPETIQLNYEKVGQLTRACQSAYQYTVVDAPRVSAVVAAELAAVSTKTLIVMQLSVKDVRVAREMWKSLLESGVPAQDIILLVSRYHKRGWSISLEEARQAISCDTLMHIDDDFHAAAHSIDLGEPLSRTAPASSLRKNIRKLLSTMSPKPDQAWVRQS